MKNLRSEIKHNFLKNIIFRLDYEGIMEADIEKCVLDLRQNFINAGFITMGNRTENQVDVQLKMDLNLPNENSFSISNSNKSLVYIFSSDNNEILELSKSFFTLTVNIDKIYESFDRYIALLAETVVTLRNSSPYFKALRIGLRKINICFLKDLKNLSGYFSNAAFNIDAVIEQFSDFKCTASNMVTILSQDGYQINYVRNLQEGVMQQEDGNQQPVYQVVLDIDVFKENNREILPLLTDIESIKNILTNQNTIEFEVFIKSLCNQFVELLKKETFEDSNIEGIN